MYKQTFERLLRATATTSLLALVACGSGGGNVGNSETVTAPSPSTNISQVSSVNSPLFPSTQDAPPTVEPENNLANEADGLGAAGHVAGTVDLGLAIQSNDPRSTVPQIAIALSNQGRALAVWQVPALVLMNSSAAWAQSSAAGEWGPANPLPQVHNSSSFYGLGLKMNQAGNAVLGWMQDEFTLPDPSTERPIFNVARFIEGTGWDTNAYDASGGTTSSTSSNARNSDLTILDDDSFTKSVRLPGAPGYSSGVLRIDRQGQQTTSFRLDNQFAQIYYPYAAFSVKSNGYGLLYQAADPTSGSGQVTIRARLASIYNVAFAPFTIGTYMHICYNTAYDNSLIAAVTEQAEGVLAAITSDTIDGMPTCDKQSLQLHRIYTASAIRVETKRLNTANTSLPVAPVIAVDRAGNALAVWKETTARSFDALDNGTTRLMWSRSLYGQDWSEPAPVISNLDALGTVPRSGHISLAMNANGEAIAAVTLDGLVNAADNQSIVVGRFTFDGGWTPWHTTANKQNMSEPQVAINASGQAVLAYTAQAWPRVNGRAPASYSGAPIRAFAYRF